MTGLGTRAVPIFLALCLILGGASAAGFAANLGLQLLGLTIGLIAVITVRPAGVPQADRFLRWLAILLAMIVCLQFIPLPQGFWMALPGRARIAEDLALLAVVPRPTLLTLSYHQSIASLVWLLPAAGMFVALMITRELPARALALAVVAVALLGILLGVVQFLGGQDSVGYLYDYTTRGALVGFFANANHMATLLLATLPFLSALFVSLIMQQPRFRRELTMIWAALVALILLGIVLAGALTGYALAGPALALSGLIMFPWLRRPFKLALLPAIALGAVAIGLTEEGQKLLSSDREVSERSRETMIVTTLDATANYWPAGTGLGTFREVYDDFEDADAAGEFYVHHAHNDYLELVLELGLFGLIGIAAFLAWWMSRLWAIWRAGGGGPFEEAAMIASGIILLHSAWDYPLRTAAISTLLAVCCAILSRASGQTKPDPAS
ncbi:MAG: O-antigen ligase family protein [Alteraurantiacibacter sp.]